MLTLALLMSLSAAPTTTANADEVGHISSAKGSASFTATHVFNAKADFGRRADGSWAGTVNGHTLNFEIKPDNLNGEEALWVGDTLILVHHAGAWYAKGTLLRQPVRMIWPDNQGLDGWSQFTFDGLASKPNPPIVPFVLALVVSTI
jgi:hypothetical protein